MRQLFFVFLLFLFSNVFAQKNIIDYLNLKDSLIEKYVEGELMASDTIIDLKNGYYAEVRDAKLIRQAAIFNNFDGTKTLGITVCEWDFACFNYESNFYHISTSNDSLILLKDNAVLPEVEILNFISGTEIKGILNKYLTILKGSYLSENATIEDLLNEIYEIKYILPQKGTKLKATLEVCDYIPTNEMSIEENDWKIITNDFLTLKFPYNKNIKNFELK